MIQYRWNKERREGGPGKMAPWSRALVTLAEFSSQHLYGDSKPSETPVLEDLIISLLSFSGPATYVMPICTCRPNIHKIKKYKETPIRTESMFTQVWVRVRCALRLWVGGLLKSWIHLPLHAFRILHVSACLWLPHWQRGSIDMRLSLLWFQICEQSRCVFKSLNFGMGWCIARVVCNRKLGNMLKYWTCLKIPSNAVKYSMYGSNFFFLKMAQSLKIPLWNSSYL